MLFKKLSEGRLCDQGEGITTWQECKEAVKALNGDLIYKPIRRDNFLNSFPGCFVDGFNPDSVHFQKGKNPATSYGDVVNDQKKNLAICQEKGSSLSISKHVFYFAEKYN